MSLLTHWIRVPRPQSFLYAMSLRTGVEMISLTMVFNKVTGVYGFLAILTGIHLSPTQFTMYIYSVFALLALTYLMPHIRRQSPFQNLALAYFYIIDTIINTTYTIAFAFTWLLTVSANHPDTSSGAPINGPGSGTINDTAGFTNPEFPSVTSVAVIATPAAGLAGGQDAVAVGISAAAKAVVGNSDAIDPSLGHGVGLAESMPSLVLITILTMLRIYFILIMMSYARQVLRNHMADASSARTTLHVDNETEEITVNPFSSNTPLGQGWTGKLGRVMTGMGRGFWLGSPEENDWVRSATRRFNTRPSSQNSKPNNTERERRARSGTGPPVPRVELPKLQT